MKEFWRFLHYNISYKSPFTFSKVGGLWCERLGRILLGYASYSKRGAWPMRMSVTTFWFPLENPRREEDADELSEMVRKATGYAYEQFLRAHGNPGMMTVRNGHKLSVSTVYPHRETRTTLMH